ncbi:precorrin-2 C(20)-methyltransferase [Methanobrevibacter sp. OttesenSCG-928-K11]|nr:precorrin-2 C(20)-methyltransferase [Methanobrevibacter sp. OttesenSCG-928-K11]MDL2270430.1 precorrin-2 C(20)-methyltransferase [Methanobrevibacter sp. OttesenSCG-928-I08]
MSEKGKLIGIGVGPGDSELLTIKASKTLKKVKVICAPKSSPNKESIALSIVKPTLEEREDYKKLMIVEPVFPMVEDDSILEKHWDDASAIIANYLDSGRDVAFITLGDPSIFSTFSYVQKRLKDNYVTEIIPGITSFTACAASINQPLVEKNEILTIVPKIDNRISNVLDFSDSIALMKASRNTEELENLINSKEGTKEIISVENCTNKNEKIIKGFSKNKPYLTTTIVKRK